MKLGTSKICAAAILAVLTGCNSKEQEPAKNVVSEDQINQKIAGVNFSPYSQSNYPKLWASLAPALRDGRVDRMRVQGARTAAGMTECDKVELSEVSQKSTLDNIVVFVDCTNGFRIIADEKLRVEKVQTRR